MNSEQSERMLGPIYNEVISPSKFEMIREPSSLDNSEFMESFFNKKNSPIHTVNVGSSKKIEEESNFTVLSTSPKKKQKTCLIILKYF